MQCKSEQDAAGWGILGDIPNIRRNASIQECRKRCGSESEAGSQCGVRGERVSKVVYQGRVFGPIRPVQHTTHVEPDFRQIWWLVVLKGGKSLSVVAGNRWANSMKWLNSRFSLRLIAETMNLNTSRR